MYYTGLLDEQQARTISLLQENMTTAITNEQWETATNLFLQVFEPSATGSPSLIQNYTCLSQNFDIRTCASPAMVDFVAFVNSSAVRAKLHVGNRYFGQDGNTAELMLLNDFMKSVKADLPYILSNIPAMFYNGQMDLIVAPPLTEVFLQTLNWTGIEGYMKAPKFIWKVNESDQEIAGYVRQSTNLTQVIVRNAGHMVPFNQPRAAQDMIWRFITNSFASAS